MDLVFWYIEVGFILYIDIEFIFYLVFGFFVIYD